MEKAEGALADVQGERSRVGGMGIHPYFQIMFWFMFCFQNLPASCRVAVAEMDAILGGQPPSYSNSRTARF